MCGGSFGFVASPLGRDRVFVGWQDISEDREWRDGRSLLIEAQQALIQGHLVLWYQPIVSLESGRTVGWEGLIRWPQPDGSIRNPGDFIPLLNRAGLAAPLFWATVEQALAHLQALKDGYVAVNLDPAVIEDAQFPYRVAAMCDRYGVERDRLCLELTESSALALPLIPKLEAARGQGNRVAIDDFGTGYAGYGGLIRLRSVVSILKLDRTMVAEIHRDPTRQDILRSVVVLAHSLGFVLVAEGIESEDERRWLQAAGCDCGQGYLFGHPAPP
jgi:FOG: EAL domain